MHPLLSVSVASILLVFLVLLLVWALGWHQDLHVKVLGGLVEHSGFVLLDLVLDLALHILEVVGLPVSAVVLLLEVPVALLVCVVLLAGKLGVCGPWWGVLPDELTSYDLTALVAIDSPLDVLLV